VNDREVCNLYHSITWNRDAFRFSGAFRASQKLFRATQPHFGEYPLFSMPGFARDHVASRGPLLRPLTPRHLNRNRVAGLYFLEPSGGEFRLGTFELRTISPPGEKHNQIDGLRAGERQGQTAILCRSIEPPELARARYWQALRALACQRRMSGRLKGSTSPIFYAEPILGSAIHRHH
jgi:hypothetical protein